MAHLGFAIEDVLGFESDPNLYLGVNVSDRGDDWMFNVRCPDVAVYLPGTAAISYEAHWQGGPDLAIEIVSPYDRSREKISFYEAVGTRELWILDRDPWSLEQWIPSDGRLVSQGRSLCDSAAALASRVLPITMRLVSGTARPRVEIVCTSDQRSWLA